MLKAGHDFFQEYMSSLLRVHVFPVGAHCFGTLLDAGEVHEVAWSVHLMIKLLWVGKGKLVPHVGIVSHTHEIVIP